MEIARVTGTVVATRKDELIEGFKLLSLEVLDPADLSPKGMRLVGVDIVDAGVGDVVLIVRGSSARTATGLQGRPIDTTVVAVVDEIVVGGKTIYKKGAG